MPRRSTISYFPSRKAYYTQIDGMQNHLATGPKDEPDGPTYKAALRKFAALVCDSRADTAKDDNPVGLILARFLIHSKAHRRASTAKVKEKLFRPFASVYGELCMAELRHRHVYEFLDRMRSGADGRKWGSQTCRLFVAVLQAAFNWAAKPGVELVTCNPLKGIERPGAKSRSRECLISADVHALLCQKASRFLRDALVCLENTGARPGELIAAHARDWRDDLGALVYHQDELRTEEDFAHKTSDSKERVILFTGQALTVMRRLVRQHPSGPLFRSRTGKGYTGDGLRRSFNFLCERLGLENVCLYSYRHTFATSWLRVNPNIDQLAAVMGNTPEVIRRNYAHLIGDKAGLRAALEAVKASQAQPASPELKLHAPGEGAA
jgi:integrase